jgi:hypothetical protein
VDENESVMEFVVEVPVAPMGKVHVYEVAPGIAGVVKIWPDELLQTPSGPEIEVGELKGVKLLSILPSQLSSKPLHISMDPGFIAEFPSLQSVLLVTYPIGTVELFELMKTLRFPNPSESLSL